MLFESHRAESLPQESESHPTMNTFQWLVILGFPVEVAAAKAMPELFSDSVPSGFVTDGVRVWSKA